jgi:hypothetical protein
MYANTGKRMRSTARIAGEIVIQSSPYQLSQYPHCVAQCQSPMLLHWLTIVTFICSLVLPLLICGIWNRYLFELLIAFLPMLRSDYIL